MLSTHVSICLCTYRQILNNIVVIGLTMFPTRAIDYLIKPPVPDIGNVHSSCWSRESKKLPKQYRLLLLPLAASQN